MLFTLWFYNCLQLGESLIYGALTAVSHTGGAWHPRGSAKLHAALEKRGGTCLFSKHDFLGWWPIWKMLSATATASLWRWIELRAESGGAVGAVKEGALGYMAFWLVRRLIHVMRRRFQRHGAMLRLAGSGGTKQRADAWAAEAWAERVTRKQVRGAIGKQREPSVASAALIRHDLCATVPNRTVEQHGECKILPPCNVRATNMRQLERVARGS